MSHEQWRRWFHLSELSIQHSQAKLELADEEVNECRRQLNLAQTALDEEIENNAVLAEMEHEIRRWADELGACSVEVRR